MSGAILAFRFRFRIPRIPTAIWKSAGASWKSRKTARTTTSTNSPRNIWEIPCTPSGSPAKSASPTKSSRIRSAPWDEKFGDRKIEIRNLKIEICKNLRSVFQFPFSVFDFPFSCSIPPLDREPKTNNQNPTAQPQKLKTENLFSQSRGDARGLAPIRPSENQQQAL